MEGVGGTGEDRVGGRGGEWDRVQARPWLFGEQGRREGVGTWQGRPPLPVNSHTPGKTLPSASSGIRSVKIL